MAWNTGMKKEVKLDRVSSLVISTSNIFEENTFSEEECMAFLERLSAIVIRSAIANTPEEKQGKEIGIALAIMKKNIKQRIKEEQELLKKPWYFQLIPDKAANPNEPTGLANVEKSLKGDDESQAKSSKIYKSLDEYHNEVVAFHKHLGREGIDVIPSIMLVRRDEKFAIHLHDFKSNETVEKAIEKIVDEMDPDILSLVVTGIATPINNYEEKLPDLHQAVRQQHSHFLCITSVDKDNHFMRFIARMDDQGLHEITEVPNMVGAIVPKMTKSWAKM
jgi:hypothetical protein